MLGQDGDLSSLHLIDFGVTTKFHGKMGVHFKDAEVDEFRGNIRFASAHRLNFRTASRRDDIISLCYILCFLLGFSDFFTGHTSDFETVVTDDVFIKSLRAK